MPGWYLVVRGPLGVGKTTVSRLVADALGGIYVGLDDVLARRGLDQIDPLTGRIPLQNFVHASESMLPSSRALLDDEGIVVFDGCFYYPEQLMHLIENLAYPHAVFTLTAPLAVCVARDAGRRQSYGQDAAEAVYRMVLAFDAGAKIDTEGQTPADTAQLILAHLPPPRTHSSNQ